MSLGHSLKLGETTVTPENSVLRDSPCRHSFDPPQDEPLGDNIFQSVGKVFEIGKSLSGFKSLELPRTEPSEGMCAVAVGGVNVGLMKILRNGLECLKNETEEGNCLSKKYEIFNNIQTAAVFKPSGDS